MGALVRTSFFSRRPIKNSRQQSFLSSATLSESGLPRVPTSHIQELTLWGYANVFWCPLVSFSGMKWTLNLLTALGDPLASVLNVRYYFPTMFAPCSVRHWLVSGATPGRIIFFTASLDWMGDYLDIDCSGAVAGSALPERLSSKEGLILVPFRPFR